jgi:protein ImuB
VLARVATQPAVDVELATPSATMEPVLFLVRAALDRLVTDLVARGRAVAAVAITLTLDDARGALPNAPAHTVTREARTARPLARLLPLFERCRALLDSWTLDAPVIAVRVAIAATAPLSGEQGDLLTTSWRDLGAADAALERLRAELGTGVVVRAQAQDTHRPERAGIWEELTSDGRTVGLSDRQTVRPVSSAHRSLDPPEKVDVICDGETPRSVMWRGQRTAVTRATGPERLSGDWWDDGYRRDYWRCESVAGEAVVYLDRADDSWRLQAWID